MPSKAEAVAASWEMLADDPEQYRGWALKGILAKCQFKVYQATTQSPARVYVWEMPRRWGKSLTMAGMATEQAIMQPGSLIHYGAQTGKQVTNIVVPNMRIIHQHMPRSMRPQWKRADGLWVFPNGSEIHMAGCEDELKADRLRGSASDLFLFDEAGFIPPLKYAVMSIALPMTMTTGGRIIIGSTPPLSPSHDFISMATEAEAKGAYQHRTIHQCTRFTDTQIAEFCKEAGGAESTEWQREYLAMRVVDAERAVVPEFTQRADRLVGTVERPKWIAPMTTVDVGFKDPTAMVFSYWNHAIGKLVVEDELGLDRATTDEIAEGLRERELALWGEYWKWAESLGEIEEGAHHPYHRYSDVDLRLIHDLAEKHGIAVNAVVKARGSGESGFVEASLHRVRLMVKREELLIHPRCKNLIAQLRGGIWNKHRTDWERIEGLGHLDFLDALRYQVWHLDRQFDPTPLIDPERSTDSTHVSTRRLQELRRERDGDLEDLADALLPLE